MNFDPFQFFDDDYFGRQIQDGGSCLYSVQQSIYWIAGLLIAAVVIGTVLNFTFFGKKNEGRYGGFRGRIYDFFSMNRFYAEDMVKLLGIITSLAVTFLGIYLIVTGKVLGGIVLLILGNLAARLCFELIMMLVIFCKKTVSIDKRLADMEAGNCSEADASPETAQDGEADIQNDICGEAAELRDDVRDEEAKLQDDIREADAASQKKPAFDAQEDGTDEDERADDGVEKQNQPESEEYGIQAD